MNKVIIALLAIFLTTNSAYCQKIKLIIDAGHGGKDFGAKNKAGEKESDLCLLMAEVLQKYAAENNMETVMTRTKKEQFLTHEQRSGYKVDKNYSTYYISLHMDKDKSTTTRGMKMYYCSKAVNSGVGKTLAEKIGKSLERINGGKAKIEDKEAIILTRNTVPSVMVYYGYVTNPQDTKLAKDPAYQREVAMLIIRSIMETKY